jgi:ATP-dependent DNA helicase RecQ
VLKGERKVELRQYQKPVKQKRHAGSARSYAELDLSPAEQKIFEKLRWWRMETARAHSVAAFIIFGDATLREIAKVKPTSLDELRGVSGVGAKKLTSYGDEIVSMISEMV